MEDVVKQSFSNQTVVVDGKQFNGCVFVNATLVYTGGQVPDFVNCRFSGITLEFEDSADNTLRFLTGLRRGGFVAAVDKILNSARK